MKQFLTNFSIHESHKSTVEVYDESCMGNQATKADVMLSFGSECTPRNGNNESLTVENCVVDVFLNKQQALDLYNRLGKVLNQNKG